MNQIIRLHRLFEFYLYINNYMFTIFDHLFIWLDCPPTATSRQVVYKKLYFNPTSDEKRHNTSKNIV